MFWVGASVVVVVGTAVAWWTSGRQRAGVDDARVGRLRKRSVGSTSNYDKGTG